MLSMKVIIVHTILYMLNNTSCAFRRCIQMMKQSKLIFQMQCICEKQKGKLANISSKPSKQCKSWMQISMVLQSDVHETWSRVILFPQVFMNIRFIYFTTETITLLPYEKSKSSAGDWKSKSITSIFVFLTTVAWINRKIYMLAHFENRRYLNW